MGGPTGSSAARAKGYAPSGAAYPVDGLNNIVAGVRKIPGSKYVISRTAMREWIIGLVKQIQITTNQTKGNPSYISFGTNSLARYAAAKQLSSEKHTASDLRIAQVSANAMQGRSAPCT